MRENEDVTEAVEDQEEEADKPHEEPEKPQPEDEQNESSPGPSTSHKMNLREKRHIRKPKRYEVFTTDMPYQDEMEPLNAQDVTHSPNRVHWERAMKEELKSMDEHHVWDLTELPVGFKPIGCRWVFKIKKNEHGNIDKFEARLVVKGYSQRAGIDYKPTFQSRRSLRDYPNDLKCRGI